MSTPTGDREFSLRGLHDLLQNHPRQPVGFIVSRAVFFGLRRVKSGPVMSAIGVSIVMDPDLPETEFEAVFDAEVWLRRLNEISNKQRE